MARPGLLLSFCRSWMKWNVEQTLLLMMMSIRRVMSLDHKRSECYIFFILLLLISYISSSDGMQIGPGFRVELPRVIDSIENILMYPRLDSLAPSKMSQGNGEISLHAKWGKEGRWVPNILWWCDWNILWYPNVILSHVISHPNSKDEDQNQNQDDDFTDTSTQYFFLVQTTSLLFHPSNRYSQIEWVDARRAKSEEERHICTLTGIPQESHTLRLFETKQVESNLLL